MNFDGPMYGGVCLFLHVLMLYTRALSEISTGVS